MVSLPDPQHTAVQLSKKLKSLLIHANTAWSQGWTGTKETTDNHRWQHLTESVLDSTGLFCLHFCTLTTRTMTPANCCDTRLWNNLLHHYFLGLMLSREPQQCWHHLNKTWEEWVFDTDLSDGWDRFQTWTKTRWNPNFGDLTVFGNTALIYKVVSWTWQVQGLWCCYSASILLFINSTSRLY